MISKNSFALLSVVYDPYDVIQNTITAKNSVQALINQAQEMKNDLQNLKSLVKGKNENILGLLKNLSEVASQGQALSYGINSLEKKYNQSFPGIIKDNNYNKDFGIWSAVTYDTLKNAMLAMSLHGKAFSGEDQNLQSLQALSNSSSGNLEAHQTSHRIAIEEVTQLQKLRQLLLTQGSAQNIFMSYQLQKEQSQQAAMHDWIVNSQISFKSYTGNEGFGVNEVP
jgi:P-type conjugative transfer protein TrbJ